jgi:hypothetical protein
LDWENGVPVVLIDAGLFDSRVERMVEYLCSAPLSPLFEVAEKLLSKPEKPEWILKDVMR